MTDGRPPIPASLERSLLIEAGYRCAVCKTPEPLQIDHITEWSKAQAHDFENMIVLCANCHARKKNSSDARHINRASLTRIKSNLMLLNGRYSDLERRIIDFFKHALIQNEAMFGPEIETNPAVMIPSYLSLLVGHLIGDDLVTSTQYESPSSKSWPDGTILRDIVLKLELTSKGRQFIANLEHH